MIQTLRHTSSRRLLLLVSALLVVVAAIAYFILVYICRPYVISQCRDFLDLNATLAIQHNNFCQYNLFFLDLIPELLKALIGAAITSAVFILVWRFIRPTEEELDDVAVLDRPACRDRHMKALETSDFWFHDGHIAKWVRTHVLPAFRRRAKGMASLTVCAAIIDPRDEELCGAYLDHIKHLPVDEQHSKDLNELRAELCGSILAFYYEHGRSPYVSVKLYLKTRIDYIRDDIASDCAFMTIVGADTPGIVVSKRGDNSTFYNIMRTNFNATRTKDALLNFYSGYTALGNDPAITPQHANQVLTHLLGQHDFITDDFCEEALRKTSLDEGVAWLG
ncbi:MAG TPA: hypothetical protein VF650_16050 [Allosphingosinicella sp.]|jgi:hypothetical protein